MKLRPLSIPLTILAGALILLTMAPLLATAQPARNPFLDPPPAQDGPPTQGGPGGGRRDGGGGDFGGGRGDNFTQRTGETTEQYRLRLISPYLDLVPDLTEDQKTHIIAILQAANIESQAIRADTTLSQDRQRAAGQMVRADIPNRIKNALTDAQLADYTEALEARNNAATEMQKVIAENPDEDIEVGRERAIKGYEDFLDELSVKQKTEVIRILVAAENDEYHIDLDANKTAPQKKAAVLQIHEGLSAKVTPLLEADQVADWKKAHDAARPQ